MDREVKSVSQLREALEHAGLDGSKLSPIGVRPPLHSYLEQLWERRRFIWYDSRQRTATANSGKILGNAWLMLRPLLDAAFYFLIFGLLLGTRGGIENFAAFVIVGVLMYRFTAAALGGGASIMQSNRSIIRAFTFPRAAIPVSNVVRGAMTGAFTVLVMCLAIIVVPPHEFPELAWVCVPVLFALQVLLNLGIMLITSRIGFHFPDAANFLGVISRFIMYGSGVIFPVDRFITNDTIRFIVELNPIYRLLVMYRGALIDGVFPQAESWVILIAWILVLVTGGFIFFWRGEASYGRTFR